MITEKNRQHIKIIANYYGGGQLDLLQEECAELIQAISKYKRVIHSGQQPSKPISKEMAQANIVEEIADVLVMIEQAKYLLAINENYIDKVIGEKLDRTMNILLEAEK